MKILITLMVLLSAQIASAQEEKKPYEKTAAQLRTEELTGRTYDWEAAKKTQAARVNAWAKRNDPDGKVEAFYEKVSEAKSILKSTQEEIVAVSEGYNACYKKLGKAAPLNTGRIIDKAAIRSLGVTTGVSSEDGLGDATALNAELRDLVSKISSATGACRKELKGGSK